MKRLNLGNLGAIRSKLDEIKDKKRLGSKLGVTSQILIIIIHIERFH